MPYINKTTKGYRFNTYDPAVVERKKINSWWDLLTDKEKREYIERLKQELKTA